VGTEVEGEAQGRQATMSDWQINRESVVPMTQSEHEAVRREGHVVLNSTTAGSCRPISLFQHCMIAAKHLPTDAIVVLEGMDPRDSDHEVIARAVTALDQP
jgi:hypothetical protein